MVKKQAKKSKFIKKKIAKKPAFIHFEFKGFLSFLILHELNTKKMTGEDLGKKIGRRKGTVLTPGTIYPALKKLRENGFVVYKKFGRKKVYSLTAVGKKELTRFYSLFSVYFSGMKNLIKK